MFTLTGYLWALGGAACVIIAAILYGMATTTWKRAEDWRDAAGTLVFYALSALAGAGGIMLIIKCFLLMVFGHP